MLRTFALLSMFIQIALPITANAQAVRTAPSGGNTTLTTTAATTIPAGTYAATRYQVQGAGYGCASWVTATITISANTAAATCTGNGSFLITAGSVETRTAIVANTALTAIGATGASLVVVWETQ